jgi:hypothetical protein
MSQKKAASLKTDDTLCSFCQRAPAVICVQRPLPHRIKKKYSQSLCLLHYYSTSAVRETKAVSIIDASLLQEQLPQTQELFAEAFVQLQQTIQEEVAKSFDDNTENDPLAVIQDWHRRRPKILPTKPKTVHNQINMATEGGFLRHTPLPERLLLKRQQQAMKQQELEKRMQRASTDLTLKRKPNRTIIWNQLSVSSQDTRTRSKKKNAPTEIAADLTVEDNPTCSSCHSQNVQQIGNFTSRNGEMAKGETWGSKDRGDEVLGRYQCQTCGKVWNESE